MSKQDITIVPPDLNEGETLVGSIITEDSRYHLVRLPGEAEPATHKAQLEWAASIGGDLPDRVESALLFKKHKSQFQERRYWTNEIDAEVPDYAWYQSFGNGNQYWLNRNYELRARAVRRISF